jgi:glycosyltransferase involved in cell wall biosynthesis
MTSAAAIEPALISIILLCFNHEKYIDEALDGIFAQTYSPLDIIIHDDCSSDRTAEFIESRLAQRHHQSNIRFVRNPRNTVHPIPDVLRMVKGSFLVISSGDDIMLPGMVERMARTWLEEKVSLVTTNAFYIDENSNSLNQTFRDLGAPADDSFETLARDGSNACCFGAAMGFDRAIYDTFGWPPTHFLEASDIVLPFYAYLLRGARFINEPLLKYRVHSHNTSLSLLAEKSAGENALLVRERIFGCHLAHAVFFEEELDRLRSELPSRYANVSNRILPLVGIQMTEMAKKLVRNRRELDNLRRQQVQNDWK